MRFCSIKTVCSAFLWSVSLLVCVGVSVAHAAPSGWQEIIDTIRERISSSQPPIGPHSISIQYSRRGIITLEGEVESEQVRERVQKIAEGVDGVSKVSNELTVASGGIGGQTEEAQRLQDAFRREVPNGRYRLQVLSNSGGIILRGTVDSKATQDKILSVASSVSKKRVIDELVVEAVRSDLAVEDAIRRVLAQEYPHLIQGLQVSSRDGEVTVSGDMRNHLEVDKVLSTILMAEGVRSVDSKLTVKGMPYPSPE